ncbi:hypothetical protein [Vibrio breoganii]|uniref:hypothetical protein n=1 Tax=Vibrio breoganii TaxID=553239 RepID=UPI0021C2A90B|nr:hypothetical protein [Vibrio breoganii]MDN3714841.1 hypothetical protein [Vibrio breoganii]
MIELNHIGEKLICEMINSSDSVKSVLMCAMGIESSAFIAVPEIRLDACSGLIFDGVHKVDVCILDTQNNTCFPIEAKLGLDRLSKNEFAKRFMKPCKTSHNDTRVAGSMISILERQLPSQCTNQDLTVSYQGQKYVLTKEWGLISRSAIHNKWHSNGFPSLTEKCKHVAFESLARTYGDKGAFNNLVTNLLNVDFHAQWVK